MPRKPSRREAQRWVTYFVAGAIVLVFAFVAAWHWTPLHEYAEPRALAHYLRSIAKTPWAPLFVGVIYVAASLVVFPNTVLCLAVIMTLGSFWGTVYAYGGSLLAALVGYLIGRRGGERVKKLDVGPFQRASAELRRGGFMRILSLRLLPVVPFGVTNILSGAARAPLITFLLSTVIGISPYILTFALLGRQARKLLIEPSPLNAGLAIGIAIAASIVLWRARSWASARSR